MTIRPLTSGDIEPAIGLWVEVGLTRPWNEPRTDLERALRGPDSTVLGAHDGGQLIGTAMVGHDGHRGWVYYLAVAPAHQGRGLTRSLISACEDWVRARDIPTIQLMVRRDNTDALSFYQRLGYAVSDVAVFGRRLTPPEPAQHATGNAP